MSSRRIDATFDVPEKISIWLKFSFGTVSVVTSVSLHLELISVPLVAISENFVDIVFKSELVFVNTFEVAVTSTI
jgi:hypothetical protein